MKKWIATSLDMPPDKHLLQFLDTVALPESTIISYALHHALGEISHRKTCDYRQATHCGD